MPDDQSTPVQHPEVALALRQLAASGLLTGQWSDEITAQVDPGVYAVAAKRFGIPAGQVSDVINAALAVAAAPDTFKQWLRNPGPRLPDDFELAF